jgi:uncharacterized protein YciI
MPHFVLTCIDKPNALDARMGAREAHLAHVRESGIVRLAGPFLDESGAMTGSLLIVEAETLAQAQAFSAADPYVAAGVFQSVDIRPFKVTVGAL